MNPFSVIMPSRNAANIVPCVKAIREAGETGRIIVVDDGLHWERIETELEELAHRPGLGRVNGESPFIFARNVNIGIREAGNDDVILLNDDALLKTPMGFTAMREAQRYGGHGIVGAITNSVGNAAQLRDRDRESIGIAVRDEPRMLCFVCVLIPRTTIDAIGLLDERYIGYGLDDDDYCLTARKAGLRLGIYDGCFVDHLSLNSSFRGADRRPGTNGNFHPNMKRFIEKWGVDNWGKDREHSQFAALFPPPEAPQ